MTGKRTFPLLLEMAQGKKLDASHTRGVGHSRQVWYSIHRLREMGLIESVHQITPAGQEYVRDMLAKQAREAKKAK